MWIPGVTRSVSLLSPSAEVSALPFPLRAHFSLLALSSILPLKPLCRVIHTECLCSLTSIRPLTHPESEACFITPLKVHSVQRAGIAVTVLTNSMDTFYFSLPLTLWAVFDLTGLSIFLGTLFSGPGFLLATASHFLHRFLLSWTFTHRGVLGPMLELFFLQSLLDGFLLASGFHLTKVTKAPTFIKSASDFYTYLIPPLGFLRSISCATDPNWNLDSHLLPKPLLHLSKCHHRLLCCTSRWSESFHLQNVHRTIPLGSPSKHHLVMKWPLIPRLFPKVAEVCKLQK